ncbi:MAG: hypothetical protein U5L98_09905 [Halomonas sp.]|uniref:hypothetical protein n=1 Tax=Halomonas sp. TaxID=1486246 RepID=UPI002ACE143C|nr:hypothetical protein [Halomonas sp.]MDZ7852938.1 hypothetical protein [Halomonas sp.]
MTTRQDTAAIERANELLADPGASSADLIEVKQAVSDAMRQLQHPVGIRAAKSFAEREQLEQQERDRAAAFDIHESLFRALIPAIEQAEAREAVTNSPAAVSALDKALDTLEEAQRREREAMAQVHARTSEIKAMKKAAGHHSKVGAPKPLVDRIVALGAIDGGGMPTGHAAEAGLRRTAQLDEE